MLVNVDEAKKSGIFITGLSGSGKTNLAFLIAKQLIKNDIILYIFDPSQAWNKKFKDIDKGFKLDIKPDNLNILYDPKRSQIFDISRLYVEKQKTIVQKVTEDIFMSRLKQDYPYTILIFEEAQLYLNQGSLSSNVAQELLRLITVGRNFNLRFVLLTTFPAIVDKTAIKACKQKYFGFFDEPNDINYLKFYLKEKTTNLKAFQVGEFYNTCGSILRRIKVNEYGKENDDITTITEEVKRL